MEAQEFYNGEIVRISNRFSPHYGEEGMIVGNKKGPSEIIDDTETTYYYVALGPLMYKFDTWELQKADQEANHKEAQKKEHHYDGAMQPIELNRSELIMKYKWNVDDYVYINDRDDKNYGFLAIIRQREIPEEPFDGTPLYRVDVPGIAENCLYWENELTNPLNIFGKPKDDEKFMKDEEIDLSHHYEGDVQPIELMQAQMSQEEFIGFLKGNIIKYAARLGKKDAPEKEAKKIVRYAQWLLEVIEGRTINPNE